MSVLPEDLRDAPAVPAPEEQPLALALDSIAAVLILLVAASNAGNWARGLPIESFLVRALWWLLYLGAFLRLFQAFGPTWLGWTARYQPALSLLLALAVCSTAWSPVPLETLQRSLSLIGTTVLGVYIGYLLPPANVARVLGWSFTIILLASLVTLPMLPDSVVIEPWTGEWRGLMNHKNSFGALAAIASLFFLAAILQTRGTLVWPIAMLGASLLALVLSDSATAVVATVVGTATLICFAAANRAEVSPRTAFLILALALAFTTVVAVRFVDPITRVLGRDPTLTARTDRWAGAVQIMRERPITGYGYHAVWGRKDNTLLPHIPITAHRSSTSAHNAVLQAASELGIPAAILLTMYFLRTLFAAVRFQTHRETAFPLFTIAFVIATLTLNIAEAAMLGIHSLMWILFVAIAIMLRRSEAPA